MLPSESGENIATKKTFLADLIGHPKLLAQYLLPHFFKSCVYSLRLSIRHWISSSSLQVEIFVLEVISRVGSTMALDGT
jgi:hypothetical protein